MTRPKTWPCRECGAHFTHAIRSTRYCSDRCRSKAKRARVARENARNKRLSNAVKLARGCDTCGYNHCARALHWHHVDPTTKSIAVRGAHLLSGRIATERDTKCVLLCANCHYEQHDNPA